MTATLANPEFNAAPGDQTIGGCVETLDWSTIEDHLSTRGYACTPPLLTPQECTRLIALYSSTDRFRSTVVMERHAFGLGEYRYFGYPLPRIVQSLRRHFYRRLAPIAREWAQQLSTEDMFPNDLQSFLEICHASGQTKPTPLLLRYEKEGFNCLHQDIYGEVVFPIQLTVALSRPGIDFVGGEFLLTEQRPRVQSRAEVVVLNQGEVVIFATRHRPIAGARGFFRANMRHGVSRIRSGRRFSLGVILHDAA